MQTGLDSGFLDSRLKARRKLWSPGLPLCLISTRHAAFRDVHGSGRNVTHLHQPPPQTAIMVFRQLRADGWRVFRFKTSGRFRRISRPTHTQLFRKRSVWPVCEYEHKRVKLWWQCWEKKVYAVIVWRLKEDKRCWDLGVNRLSLCTIELHP